MRFYLVLALCLALLLQLDAVRVAHNQAAPYHFSTTPAALRRVAGNNSFQNGQPPSGGGPPPDGPPPPQPMGTSPSN